MDNLYWQPEIQPSPSGDKIVLRLRDRSDPNDAAMVFALIAPGQDVDPASALVMIDPTRMTIEKLLDRLALGFVGYYHPIIRPICEGAALRLTRNREHIVLYADLSAKCGTMVYGYAFDPTRPEREIAHWRTQARESNSMFAPYLPDDTAH